MSSQIVIIFDNGDEPYFKWLNQHAEGFVINAERNKNSDTMVLHRATCGTINTYHPRAQRGGFTERLYIKICSPDLESLRTWVHQYGQPNDSSIKECSLCKPG